MFKLPFISLALLVCMCATTHGQSVLDHMTKTEKENIVKSLTREANTGKIISLDNKSYSNVDQAKILLAPDSLIIPPKGELVPRYFVTVEMKDGRKLTRRISKYVFENLQVGEALVIEREW